MTHKYITIKLLNYNQSFLVYSQDLMLLSQYKTYHSFKSYCLFKNSNGVFKIVSISLEIQSLSTIGSCKMKVKYFYSKREDPRHSYNEIKAKPTPISISSLVLSVMNLLLIFWAPRAWTAPPLCLSSAPHPADLIGSGQLHSLPAAILGHTCVLTAPIYWGFLCCFTFISGLLASILGLQTTT